MISIVNSASAPRTVSHADTTYVSASRLNLWLRCPLAWQLKYRDGITTPTTPSLLVGKVVHAGLEIWYRHQQLQQTISPEAVISQLDDIWHEMVERERIRFASPEDEVTYLVQAGELVAAYLRRLPEDEARPLGVEAQLEVPLIDPANGENLGVRLLGFIDLVLSDSAGPIIVDFKTAASSAAPSPQAHEIQLTIYAYLLRIASGERESQLQIRSLIKTKSPKIAIHQYLARDERHFRRLYAVIREYLDALDRQQFTYRPSWTCTTCDYCHSHCARWQG